MQASCNHLLLDGNCNHGIWRDGNIYDILPWYSCIEKKKKKKQYQKTATPETETNKKTTVPGSRRAA